MAVSYMELVLILLGIGLVVALVTNPKTRWVGLTLVAMSIGLVLAIWMTNFRRHSSWQGFEMSSATAAPRKVGGTRDSLNPIPPNVDPDEIYKDFRNIDPPRRANPGSISTEAAASSEKPGGEGRVIQSLGRAIGQAIERGKQEKKTARATPAPPAAPDKKPAAADPSADPQINTMAKSLLGAVFAELPEDVDELAALRLLGRYLGRAIASEQARASGPDPVAGPQDVDSQGAATAASASRPAWIEAPPGRVGDGYQIVTDVGPYTTSIECEQALPRVLDKCVADYVEIYLGPLAREQVHLDKDYLLAHVVRERWEEPIDSAYEPMVRLHARLVFDQDVKERLDEIWDRVRVQGRIAIAGAGLAGVLAVLAVAWGLVKLDIKTGGSYRSLAVVIFFLSTVAVGAVVLLSYAA